MKSTQMQLETWILLWEHEILRHAYMIILTYNYLKKKTWCIKFFKFIIHNLSLRCFLHFNSTF